MESWELGQEFCMCVQCGLLLWLYHMSLCAVRSVTLVVSYEFVCVQCGLLLWWYHMSLFVCSAVCYFGGII
jgi:hypothetical protein